MEWTKMSDAQSLGFYGRLNIRRPWSKGLSHNWWVPSLSPFSVSLSCCILGPYTYLLLVADCTSALFLSVCTRAALAYSMNVWVNVWWSAFELQAIHHFVLGNYPLTVCAVSWWEVWSLIFSNRKAVFKHTMNHTQVDSDLLVNIFRAILWTGFYLWIL